MINELDELIERDARAERLSRVKRLPTTAPEKDGWRSFWYEFQGKTYNLAWNVPQARAREGNANKPELVVAVFLDDLIKEGLLLVPGRTK